MNAPQPAKMPARVRWRRVVIRGTIAVLLTTILTPVVLGFLSTYLLLNPPCGANRRTPGDYGHAWEDITLDARAGGHIRGYYILGTNDAAVIIPPPYASGRGNRLYEADVLARHGYAVLTFESRRCAGMGSLSLGYKETDEVGDALDFLLTRGEVDPDRIGILGFSSAGATAVMATARFSQIRAVVAEGGYGDFAEGAVGLKNARGSLLERLYKWSIGQSYRLITGISIDRLSPVNVAGQLAPRPLLLIYGSRERSLQGARDQQAAAGDNAQLWVVEGAGHGNYLDIAPDEYEQRVVAFFDAALLAKSN